MSESEGLGDKNRGHNTNNLGLDVILTKKIYEKVIGFLEIYRGQYSYLY